MLKELRYDREAADDDSGGELSGRPQTHADYIVADVRRLGYFPGIVRS